MPFRISAKIRQHRRIEGRREAEKETGNEQAVHQMPQGRKESWPEVRTHNV
jgi:hypothetical protein